MPAHLRHCVAGVLLGIDAVNVVPGTAAIIVDVVASDFFGIEVRSRQNHPTGQNHATV